MSQTPTDTAPDLIALLGSRICHDLISPIGAISNGVELLTLDGVGKGSELSLVCDSVTAANARIRFFRIAFGIARTGQAIGRPEILGILHDSYRSGRITLDWSSPADLQRREVKTVFLLLLCAEQALPLGGRIQVTRDDDRWSLTLISARLRHDPALWAMLQDDPALPPDLGAAEVQFALAGQALRAMQRPARIAVTEEALTLSF
ncbi:MAG: hypothetical protein RIT14_1506 [Pseudomonadota bacterium]|jgi:histidine phosphotransferase ChpT